MELLMKMGEKTEKPGIILTEVSQTETKTNSEMLKQIDKPDLLETARQIEMED